ncbi:MAG: hypothetical protein K8I30_07080 [Anaerolineae bacterium]|nr:hypothetical protein [Anaerolineae bacterium]
MDILISKSRLTTLYSNPRLIAKIQQAASFQSPAPRKSNAFALSGNWQLVTGNSQNGDTQHAQ